jgi:hypothetical protein
MATKLRIGCKRKGRFRRGKDRRLPRLVCGDTLCQSFEAKNASSHRINVSEVLRVAEDFQVARVSPQTSGAPGSTASRSLIAGMPSARRLTR